MTPWKDQVSDWVDKVVIYGVGLILVVIGSLALDKLGRTVNPPPPAPSAIVGDRREAEMDSIYEEIKDNYPGIKKPRLIVELPSYWRAQNDSSVELAGIASGDGELVAFHPMMFTASYSHESRVKLMRHELVHIWMDQQGYSQEDVHNDSPVFKSFCKKFGAED